MKTFTLFVAVVFSVFTAQSQTLSLGNKVWWDVNDNGIRDAGESGMAYVTVTLYQDNDNDGVADAGFTPLTTSTNGYGTYSFSDLAPGSYFVVVDAGGHHYLSTKYGGDPDNNIDNDNNGLSQDLSTFQIKGETITLQPGEETDNTGATNTNTNSTYDIGTWKYNGLGDYVWLDADGNGKQDTGEIGLAGVVVKLKNSSGVVLETTTTDPNGKYFFYDPAGYYGTHDYQVEFVTPAGYLPTDSKVGSDNMNDSDPVAGLVTGINVPMGKWDHSIDAGFKPIPVPLKLLSFGAVLQNKNVMLNWATSSEINVSHFVIERSLDGVNFIDAGMIFASGNSSSDNTYSYPDNIDNLQTGVLYYRLRSIDIDRKTSLSDVRVIKLSKQSTNTISITAFPNPAVRDIKITIPSLWQNKQVAYEIVSMNGQSVKRFTTKASSQTETINITDLQSGTYIIKVVSGGEAATQKFVKQ